MTAIGIEALPAIGPAAITLGAFDGVHLGHRHLAGATVAAARQRGAAAVAIVFTPHPDEVVRPGTVVERLLPPELTLERLAATGIDHVVPVRFDEALRSLEPGNFLAALAPAIQPRAIVMGIDSAFGRRRAGTIERVTEIGRGAASTPSRWSRSSSMARRSPRRGSARRCARATWSRRAACSAPRHSCAALSSRATTAGASSGFQRRTFRSTTVPRFHRSASTSAGSAWPEQGVGPDHPALVSVGVRPTFRRRPGAGGGVSPRLGRRPVTRRSTWSSTAAARRAAFREAVDALVAQMRADEDARRLLEHEGGPMAAIGSLW